MELIKTINEEDDIEYESESSKDEADEDLAAPKKKKKRIIKKPASKDFDDSFSFVANQKEYMIDTWSDMSAYIRKKAKSTLVDKIAKVRQERKDVENDITAEDDAKDVIDDDSDDSETNDEWDDVKVKGEDRKKKKKYQNDKDQNTSIVKMEDSEMNDEDCYFEYDESATFQSMNLSRPLLKGMNLIYAIIPYKSIFFLNHYL